MYYIIMKTVTISEEEYLKLKRKAEATDELMLKLIRGLEDIKNGRIEEWDSFIKS